MSTALALEHTQIVKTNDLNSVLLEGEITRLYPPLEDDPNLITQVELRTNRFHQTDARKHLTSFVRVSLEGLGTVRKRDLHVGRKVRVVGRLSIPHRKPAVVVAEHVEVKPQPSWNR